MTTPATPPAGPTILHTSDWHLGRLLYGKKRYAEHEAFLAWLLATLAERQVEVLIVAGDVFDNGTPSNRAQELYYRFLYQVAGTGCRHVVIVAGNHDSPSFLAAPAGLLRFLNIHVIGAAGADPAADVLVLEDGAGRAELIVCAVPYLRDRDIRVAEAGESLADKERKLLEGIAGHYREIAARAQARRQAIDHPVPVVATGHLFAAGGRTVEGDGVRELYIGSLAHVPAAIFPPHFDYVALGHLHVAQRVGGAGHIRYSGSPLAMGFGEARQEKCLCLVRPVAGEVAVEELAVPVFQRLERLSGSEAEIVAGLRALVAAGEPVWVEIAYAGEELAGALRERLDALAAGSPVEILRFKTNRQAAEALTALDEEETLEELALDEVFARCLEAHGVPAARRPELEQMYREVCVALAEADRRAE